MRRRSAHIYTLLILSGTVLLGPCDETLPPYNEPEKFLEGSFASLYIYPGLPVRPENRLAIYFTFTNIYEETLQDTVNFQGFIEIRSARVPSIKKTFQIGPANLHSGSQYYNASTKILTIDPGKSVTFAISWDFTSDDTGADPRDVIFEFYTDPICSTLCRAAKESLILTGELFVFNERAPVKTTTIISFCYLWGVCSISPVVDPPCLEEPKPSWLRCRPFADSR